MHCFLGLTFEEAYLQYKNIDIYRRRFDYKFTKSNILQLTILPPFEIKECTQDFIDDLSDELDSHMNGNGELRDISFSGVDFNSVKKGTVYLRPELPLDLQYCQQSLWEVIQDYGGQFKKRRPVISEDEIVTRAYLPIGRTKGADLFEAAVLKAKEQFEKPFKLKADGISLFETVPGQWILKEELHRFEDDLEFNEHDCFEGLVQAFYV